MLHTLKVKIVMCQLPYTAPRLHKVFQYSPDLFACRGIKDVDKHIEEEITKDIAKSRQEDTELAKALFTVHSMDDKDTVYLG